ncbi:MAG: HEAT repeat domain-containing protein, partial [Planctomycetota bacterium]
MGDEKTIFGCNLFEGNSMKNFLFLNLLLTSCLLFAQETNNKQTVFQKEFLQKLQSQEYISAIETLEKSETTVKMVLLPYLIKLLESRDAEIRFRAVMAIATIGPDAKEAIPLLKQCFFKDSNEEVSSGAVIALINISERQIDEETTHILARFRGEILALDGVEHLDATMAKTIVKFRGDCLSLNGLKEIDEVVASILSLFQGKALYLNGLQKLDESTTKALAQFRGLEIFLDGLQQLDEGTAKALA